MKNKAPLLLSIALIGFAFSSCSFEQERQVVLPQSDESELPWNGLREGEALGQLGAFQRR